MTLVQKLAILCLPYYERVKTGRRSPFYLNCSHVNRVPIGGADNWLKRTVLIKNTHLKVPFFIVILNIIVNCKRGTMLKRP